MATIYTSELVNSNLRASFSQQNITAGSHFAFITGYSGVTSTTITGINNSGNLDLFWDIELYWKYAAVAGTGFNVYIVSAPSGGYYSSSVAASGYENFEDGIPANNDGSHAASPAPDSHNLVDAVFTADSGFHRLVLEDIAVPPYLLVPIINNAEAAATVAVGMNVYGKNLQTIGP